MTRRDVNEGDVFRKGFATNALEDGATTGQIPALAADGQMEFVNAGGGSQTYASRGQYAGNNVPIAASTNGYLTWDSLAGGAAVLDISTPNAPIVLASGIYAIGAVIQAADAAGSRNFEGILHLDGENDDAISQGTLVFDHTSLSFPADMGLQCTWYIPAAGSIRLQVFNEGANTVNYKLLEAMVQLLPGGP